MDETSAKKARLELPNGHVKPEVMVQESAGGEGGAVVAAAEDDSGAVEITVRIEMHVLHCPLCARPFKPPVLQCNGGHLACARCVVALPGVVCPACEDGGGVFVPCPALDAVMSSARVACPHDGCGRYVVYHEAGEHQSACPHAPCHCTEPGCVGFAASPNALAGHLATVHAVPICNVKYGKVNRFQVAASVPRLLLVADDGRVFLLTVGALGGAGAAAVSVVCVRACAAARPRFTCKMWANRAPPAAANGNGVKSDGVLAEMQMRSSTSPGAVVAADEPTFLAVPPMYLVPSPDDASSREVLLSFRIDKVSPPGFDHIHA